MGEDSWGSEHFPIVLETRIKPDLANNYKRTPRLHKSNTDWDIFHEELDKNLKRMAGYDTMSVQVVYSTFVATIESAVLKATPSSGQGKGKSKKSRSDVHGPPSP